MLSNDLYKVVVPGALAQNDFAMNVPPSFDQRDPGASQGMPSSSRLNSNHLKLHHGVTNPIERDY